MPMILAMAYHAMVGLDLQVLEQEIRRAGAVGMDAAHLGGGGHGEENQLSSCSPSNAAQSLMLHVTSKGRPLPHRFEQHVGVEQNVHASF
jgi:hypothetical protein